RRALLASPEACHRDHPSGPAAPFFVSDAGRPLPYGPARATFHVLLRRALPGAAPVGRVRPRLHDLCHAFACRRLLAWYREGTDIDRASYLTREEIQAVLNAPDATTWSGHRDRALFAGMYNTGGRRAEVAGLGRDDLTDGQPRCLRIRARAVKRGWCRGGNRRRAC